MRFAGSFVLFVVVALAVSLECQAQTPAPTVDSKSLELVEKTRRALNASEFQTARRYANQLVESTSDVRLRLFAADTLLRCGDAKRATELFDAYVEVRPQEKPYLWQRGIALYLIDEFQKGAEQFEVHRTVNPNDVENAAWHFLCVAKQKSPRTAKQLLLPAPNDSREPMDQVLEMFRTGDTQAVKDRMNSFEESSGTAASAKFYGNFYLGLYADALGDLKTASKHLDIAAKDAPANYMGDVARVYAKHLREST